MHANSFNFSVFIFLIVTDLLLQIFPRRPPLSMLLHFSLVSGNLLLRRKKRRSHLPLRRMKTRTCLLLRRKIIYQASLPRLQNQNHLNQSTCHLDLLLQTFLIPCLIQSCCILLLPKNACYLKRLLRFVVPPTERNQLQVLSETLVKGNMVVFWSTVELLVILILLKT